MIHPIEGSTDFDSEEIRSGILAEINDLKATAQAFGWDAIRNGSWFNQFLHACLASYHERVMKLGGEAYLRGKYPGLPTEGVAGKLCEMAEQTAAIAGSLSGAAASAAVLTAGAGIPAAITAVMGEVLFSIRLQLRLVYDLHLLYGIPIDATDPEDLLGIFAVVYGVKLAEIGGVGAKALGPEVMRAQLYRLIQGNTKLIQQAVSRVLGPRIARNVTQKAILKTAVPMVGVALSAGWNYTATKLMGARVRQEVRIKAGLREETLRLHQRLCCDEQTTLAVLERLLALATADGEFSELEREVYLTFLRVLDLSNEQLIDLSGKVNADLNGVFRQLRRVDITENQEAIARCFCLIAAANGTIDRGEREVLEQLLAALSQDNTMELAEQFSARFKSEEGVLGQAMGTMADALSGAATSAAETMGSALEWIKSSVKPKNPLGAAPVPIEFQAESKETDHANLLRSMAQLNEEFAAGSMTTESYLERQSELKNQIKPPDDA